MQVHPVTRMQAHGAIARGWIKHLEAVGGDGERGGPSASTLERGVANGGEYRDRVAPVLRAKWN